MALTMSCDPSKMFLYNSLVFMLSLILIQFSLLLLFSSSRSILFLMYLKVSWALTLPLFLLLDITLLRIHLAVNLNFLHFATLAAPQSNSTEFPSAFKLDGGNFRSVIYKAGISPHCIKIP